jgi:hypothetical protein
MHCFNPSKNVLIVHFLGVVIFSKTNFKIILVFPSMIFEAKVNHINRMQIDVVKILQRRKINFSIT